LSIKELILDIFRRKYKGDRRNTVLYIITILPIMHFEITISTRFYIVLIKG